MGIDVFLEWDGQKEAREEAAGDKPQLFCTTEGHVGYLREAYHGGPYATKLLVPEAFDSETCRAEIPAAVMRERLTNITTPAMNADGGHKAAEAMIAIMQRAGAEVAGRVIHDGSTGEMSVEDAVRIREKTLYNSDEEEIAEVVQSFRDFVELAERKEAELGKPCAVYASY
jgi:hypothetical protein